LRIISDSEKKAILDVLEELLRSRREIVFALVYGSIVNPVIPGKYGDIDIAVYVKPDSLEIPEHILESQIEVEAYKVLSNRGLNLAPVEVVIINNAPYSFLVRLLKERYTVLKENEEALTDFIEGVGKRATANHHLRHESLQEVLGA
jgi:predicted nucleotidyltransferase